MTSLSSGPSAEEIGFARGEIDADTFQRLHAQLDQMTPREPALPRT